MGACYNVFIILTMCHELQMYTTVYLSQQPEQNSDLDFNNKHLLFDISTPLWHCQQPQHIFNYICLQGIDESLLQYN